MPGVNLIIMVTNWSVKGFLGPLENEIAADISNVYQLVTGLSEFSRPELLGGLSHLVHVFRIKTVHTDARDDLDNSLSVSIICQVVELTVPKAVAFLINKLTSSIANQLSEFSVEGPLQEIIDDWISFDHGNCLSQVILWELSLRTHGVDGVDVLSNID